jgi:acetolactate synthase-1/3 small subunit
MRHVLSALVTNQPGVLAHISGMLASRAFNIDSLAVGETEDSEFSRITFVVNGDARVLDQVRKQLEKIVTVVKVLDFSNRNYVERDLMLIKVSTDSGITSGTGNGSRGEIRELVEIFRGKIVDVSPGHVMVEISGQERKIESFIDLVRPYGIIEMVRTGRVALLRAEQEEDPEPEPDGAEPDGAEPDGAEPDEDEKQSD